MADEHFNKALVSRHWVETSDQDFETLLHLYNSKDYHWALFIGHLVIEKLLKAAVVGKLNQHAPFTHDLRRLAKISTLAFKQIIWNG